MAEDMAQGVDIPTARVREVEDRELALPGLPPASHGVRVRAGPEAAPAVSYAASLRSAETRSLGEAVARTDPGPTRKPALGRSPRPARGERGRIPARRLVLCSARQLARRGALPSGDQHGTPSWSCCHDPGALPDFTALGL